MFADTGAGTGAELLFAHIIRVSALVNFIKTETAKNHPEEIKNTGVGRGKGDICLGATHSNHTPLHLRLLRLTPLQPSLRPEHIDVLAKDGFVVVHHPGVGAHDCVLGEEDAAEVGPAGWDEALEDESCGGVDAHCFVDYGGAEGGGWDVSGTREEKGSCSGILGGKSLTGTAIEHIHCMLLGLRDVSRRWQDRSLAGELNTRCGSYLGSRTLLSE